MKHNQEIQSRWCRYAIFSLYLGVLASCASTKQIRDEKGRIIPGSLASMETIEIGGQKQFLLLRGNDVRNPVLLFLHGGPGSPETGFVRKYHADLEKYYTVVLWEQRGAGRTYPFTESANTMTVDRFVQDAHEVTQYLKTRFHQKKIFMVGHSWGSYLGMKTVAKYPEDYYAIVVAGLLVDTVRNEELSFAFALQRETEEHNDRAIAALEQIGPPVNGYYKNGKDGLFKERELVTEMGGSLHKKISKLDLLRGMLFPDEYSIMDSVRYIRGVYFSLNAFFPVYNQLHLMEEVPEVHIPLYVLTGRYDYQTPAALAEEYFKKIKAPTKKWIWFENSAHAQIFEESDKYLALMENEVRNLGQPTASAPDSPASHN